MSLQWIFEDKIHPEFFLSIKKSFIFEDLDKEEIIDLKTRTSTFVVQFQIMQIKYKPASSN